MNINKLNNKYRQIFNGQYLNITYYIFAYMYILKITKLVINNVYYKKINITKMLVSD